MAERQVPRPEVLSGRTIKLQTSVGELYLTINDCGEAGPFEVFLNAWESGTELAADAQAIGKLCSLVLRLPSSVPAADRIHAIIRSLRGIRAENAGGNRNNNGGGEAQSVPDAIACALSQFVR